MPGVAAMTPANPSNYPPGVSLVLTDRQIGLIHMACRHERNALRTYRAMPAGQKLAFADTRRELDRIMDACEATMPSLAVMRSRQSGE
jgi:hypothetical protein